MPKIRQLWDLFVQAETSSYEKSNWYDLFLSHFIVNLNEGKTVDEILTFCNWTGVGTLIGCELLSDVNQVCSQPGDGEDLRPLRHHLYSRGWKALVVLLSLGHQVHVGSCAKHKFFFGRPILENEYLLQNFSCSDELANLLISLFPICLESKDVSTNLVSPRISNKYLHLEEDIDVEKCLVNSPFKHKFSGLYGQTWSRSECIRSFGGRSRRGNRGSESTRCGRETLSSESENPCEDFNVATKSCVLKIKLDPMDFDYFNRVVRSDEDIKLDSVLYEPKRRSKHSKKILPVDFVDEKIKDVMQSHVGPYEFSMLVIQLLTSLCRSEQSFTIAADNSYPVCLKSVKFALENLSSIQFGSVPVQILGTRGVADLKSGLIQLLVISLEKVMSCPDVTSNVILTGILPMMLRALESSVCKMGSELSELPSDSSEFYEGEKQQQVIFGLIYSIIIFLISFLLQNSEANRIRNFLELFKIFIESNNGKLIGKTIVALTKFGNSSKAKNVINMIGQFIIILKKVRKDIVNPHSCRKLKHKKCQTDERLHHHHDLFGAIFTASVVGSGYNQNCCISGLFSVLVKLLKKPEKMSIEILNKVLKVMTDCGTCCCFATRNLLASLSDIIKSCSHRSRVLVFQLLENTLYPELGGYSTMSAEKLGCAICSKLTLEDEKDDFSNTTATLEDFQKVLSGKKFLTDCDASKTSKSLILKQNDEFRLEWPLVVKTSLRLDLFRELLSSSDFRIIQGVTCHLLKCAPKMSKVAKYSILFHIFLPNFLLSKAQFFKERDDVSVFRILSSLSIFSLLLNTVPFAEEFINQKCLSHVLELISIPLFTRHCCSVLEKTIILAVAAADTDICDLPSLITLKSAVDSANASFLKYFSNLDANKKADITNYPSAMGLKRKIPGEKKLKNSESKTVEILENVCIFWRTYANLSLCSPTLRKYFSQGRFITESHDLLRICIVCLTNKSFWAREKILKIRDPESCLIVKLIESLLTFLLATSHSECNENKEIQVIIEQLSESLLENSLENFDVRRLAEVFLKCSLVHPSLIQVIPSDPAPKPFITSLWSSCGEVGEIEENEEKIISDSESLEDDYVTADEGYEADIEVRDNNLSFEKCKVVDQNSIPCIPDPVSFPSHQEYEIEKPEQRYNPFIAYPKLCLLAVELLIKLYQEKSPGDPEKSTENKKHKNFRVGDFKKSLMEKQEPREAFKIPESQFLKKGVYFEQPDKDTMIKEAKEKNSRWNNDGLEKKNSDCEGKHFLGLISVLQRVASLCKENRHNCLILCKNNVILKILNGFKSCLAKKNDKVAELQKALLDLITALAKYSITPEELSFYLGFFKNDDPPVGHLLEPLLNLITTHCLEPNHSLRFPVSVSTNFIQNSIVDVGKKIHLLHKNEKVFSSWSSAALSLPIGSDINWPVWGQGFSVSVWLKIDKISGKTNSQNCKIKNSQKLRKVSKAESYVSACSTGVSAVSELQANESSASDFRDKEVVFPDLLHVVSIGNDNLALECWCLLDSGILIWKLTRVDAHKGYETLCEKTTDCCLPVSLWNHVAINVKDEMIRKKTIVEVTLIINGGQELVIPLSFPGIIVRKYRCSSLLLGAQSDKFKGFYFFGSLMLFTTPVFTRERAILLLGLGPNCTNLTDCQISRRSPNFTSVFALKNLLDNVDWEAILNAKQSLMRQLQNHLLIIYAAENPYIYNIYPSNSGGNISVFSEMRIFAADLRASQQTPASLVPCIFSSLDVQKYQGLIPSAIILGGSSTFLFLFARIVELSSDPEEQSKFLYLLLKLVQSDCDLFSQFINEDHANMLHKVFAASKCLSGLHILKAILDACCDKPVIQVTNGKFQIMLQSDAVIVNSRLITTILRSWKDWCASVQENEVLGLFFSALHALLQDEHPHREFNVFQLNRVEMVKNLLSFCKERLLYDDRKTLKKEICVSLVELVKALMGAPPEFSHVVAVMDCLILLHPANATYITHVKSSFYILLSAGQTYCNPEKNYDRKFKNENLESDCGKYESQQFLDNWVVNFNINNQIKKLGKRSSAPSDPNKFNKALTNLQVKLNAFESDKFGSNRNRVPNEEIDSNRYSDDLTFDSGIAGSCRDQTENLGENDEVIVKAVDGSQQNLTSLFPGTFTGSEGKTSSFTEISDEEEKYVRERERRVIEAHEDCGPQCVIAEGLLLLLRDIILVLPDCMAQQVLSHVVKLETLLVMANHKDHKVRAAVVKVFSSFVQRSSVEDVNKFIKLKGFYHLANQISLFPASRGLVEDCLELLTRGTASLQNHDFVDRCEVSSFDLACLPPLLALLPRSVHDLSLAHNLVAVIRLIYCKDECTARTLYENGLVETLVKTLVASAHFNVINSERLYQDLILLDVLQFFILIVQQVLLSPGLPNMQVISDIRLELHYMHHLEKENCGSKAICVRVIRDTLCKVLEKALDILQNKILCLQSAQKSRPSLFSSVLGGIQQDPAEVRRAQLQATSREYLINGSLPCNPPKEISRNELSERFKILIMNSVEFLVFSGAVHNQGLPLSQTELNFIYHLFPLLLQILSSVLEKRGISRRQPFSGIYWGMRDALKTQTSELIVWLLSPRQTIKTRMFTVTTLMSQPDSKKLLSMLLQLPEQAEHKFTVYLWDLMYRNKLSNTDLRSCQELKESIQQWGIISPHAIGNGSDSWGDDCNAMLAESDKQISAWEKQMELTTLKCITKYDHIVKGMSEDALAMTRLVVDFQNSERKTFMEEMKTRYSESVQISLKWSRLINNLTHERAVWFFEKSYPVFWRLDPTEGPSRERKRLIRCHLGIEEKYFLPSQRCKLEREKNPEPLSYLFEDRKDASMMLIERVHCNEKIRAMYAGNIVTPSSEIPGELLLGETCIYFVGEDRLNCETFDSSSTVWAFEDVKEIHNRRYELQERAVEIFLSNGKTYFIVLESAKERDSLMAEFADCDFPNRIPGDNLGYLMQMWREGLLTNWEYLTHLNKMAGRSYNDLMQYPVYPFVLSDYTSPTLDLGNDSVYRNFKKPMAVQEKKNEQHYINNYNELLGGLKQATLNKEPYHYGSHYSNSGTVLHFLVRLPPFTKMMLHYQDRNFDLPDRTFHSMHTTWRLASSESTTDVKEMIPEFFFLPEFLINFQGFNFGVRQNGEVVDDVVLPPWCKGNARKFILVHRQALESELVTENLPHWIDLVFGYKQTGKAAVDSINVFHPATYCGFDAESIADPVERIAWETMVKTYGQTPKQLFKNPHPLIIQSLVSNLNGSGKTFTEVNGIKWGSYVGSPAESEPSIVWKQQCKGSAFVAGLSSLTTNDVLGFPPCTTPLLQYNKDRGLGLVNSLGIRVALVSWGHSDGIIRVKMKKEFPPIPLVSVPRLDPVTVCTSEPGSNRLWIGHSSGNLTVHKFKFLSDREFLEFPERIVNLQGHKKAVKDLAVCGAYSIVVSAGEDGAVIIWDLNDDFYVRTLDLDSGPVKIVKISPTLGDIVSVVQLPDEDGPVNAVHLHSINGSAIGVVPLREAVTAVCFSVAPEGTSVNVVACGLRTGTIKLFSTWDLTLVREISSLAHPLVSLAYSNDSQLLYGSFRDGTIVAWESSGSKFGIKIPKFLNLKF